MFFRTEQDSIGDISLPYEAVYGAQTQRALNLYPTQRQKTLGTYPRLVCSLLKVKAASAKANASIGMLEVELADKIAATCLSLCEKFQPELFPVHYFHGGGGISTNMNINEVVANQVNQRYYHTRFGSYEPVHPNDHINLNHSTSDSLQTACHIAVIETLHELDSALWQVEEQFSMLISQHQCDKKLARTCLQDAVVINFADYWSGLKSSINQYRTQFLSSMDQLHAINMGGNIIGRSGDCHPEFPSVCLQELNVLFDGGYTLHTNFFQCSQSFDSLALLSGYIESLCGALIRIGQDIRLMASGPQTGFSEIRLPSVQSGSSAMPGKINPTIPEFLIQSAMQANGHCSTVKLAHTHGELDYSPWGMLVTTNLIDAITLLVDGVKVFNQHCLQGVCLNQEKNEANINSLIPVVVELKKKFGYQKTSELIKHYNGDIMVLQGLLNLESI
ncbi:lyase family protein [Vibrio metschnikovii]|uniref:lyase family protein n=1 Tax=Vibrio metschnikovii TaxID=28172 RepID=UPI001C3069F8|nr:lyase family protein [Vibrio metschnikovii]